MNKFKTGITRLLIFFVIFSLGFSFGKHHQLTIENGKKSQLDKIVDSNVLKVKVYYMHATFRCESCNKIERLGKAVLDKHYKSELTTGQISWQTVNFQQNPELTKKFEVVSSCIVVETINTKDGSNFERLDKVWTLLDNEIEFDKYVSVAIKKALNKKR